MNEELVPETEQDSYSEMKEVNTENAPTSSQPESVQNQSKCQNCTSGLKSRAKGLAAALFIYIFGLSLATLFQPQTTAVVTYLQPDGFLSTLISLAVYILIYVVLCILGVPNTFLGIICPLIFIDENFIILLLFCSIAYNISTLLSFLVGAKFLKKFILEHLFIEDGKWVTAMKRLIQRRPIWIATMWRLSYSPSWSSNYGLPALGCTLKAFFIAVNISGVFYNTVFISLGILARELLEDEDDEANITGSGEEEERETEKLETILLIVGISFLVLFLVWLARYVRKEMKKLVEEELDEIEQKEQKNFMEESL
eukprot:snap_masked-scaffold_15-processed-gene-0.8-mRNA-1 protein AED:1.00 eAED:1.00 QI:0/-1/0/0/-1/1/1/0/311